MGNKVFTNGCFDILHRGHLELLCYCRTLAGKDGHVLVGLNSDDSVKKLKGDDRPVNIAEDRKFALLSMRYVDYVEVFDDDTPYELIKRLRPDIIVKGGDYKPENVVGNDLCEVRIFQYIEGYSTTKIIQDIGNR